MQKVLKLFFIEIVQKYPHYLWNQYQKLFLIPFKHFFDDSEVKDKEKNVHVPNLVIFETSQSFVNEQKILISVGRHFIGNLDKQ